MATRHRLFLMASSPRREVFRHLLEAASLECGASLDMPGITGIFCDERSVQGRDLRDVTNYSRRRGLSLIRYRDGAPATWSASGDLTLGAHWQFEWLPALFAERTHQARLRALAASLAARPASGGDILLVGDAMPGFACQLERALARPVVHATSRLTALAHLGQKRFAAILITDAPEGLLGEIARLQQGSAPAVWLCRDQGSTAKPPAKMRLGGFIDMSDAAGSAETLQRALISSAERSTSPILAVRARIARYLEVAERHSEPVAWLKLRGPQASGAMLARLSSALEDTALRLTQPGDLVLPLQPGLFAIMRLGGERDDMRDLRSLFADEIDLEAGADITIGQCKPHQDENALLAIFNAAMPVRRAA